MAINNTTHASFPRRQWRFQPQSNHVWRLPCAADVPAGMSYTLLRSCEDAASRHLCYFSHRVHPMCGVHAASTSQQYQYWHHHQVYTLFLEGVLEREMTIDFTYNNHLQQPQYNRSRLCQGGMFQPSLSSSAHVPTWCTASAVFFMWHHHQRATGVCINVGTLFVVSSCGVGIYYSCYGIRPSHTTLDRTSSSHHRPTRSVTLCASTVA